MTKNNLVYLEDILKAIELIESYSKGIQFSELLQERMRQDAIIRQMEIIGEAANHLPDSFLEEHPDFPVREAVVMRNFLIHDYDNVEIETVWQTMFEDLPLLKKKIEKILR